jgi:hypothetical protein
VLIIVACSLTRLRWRLRNRGVGDGVVEAPIRCPEPVDREGRVWLESEVDPADGVSPSFD